MKPISFDQLQKVIEVFAPLSSSPGSPLETAELLRSLRPSLMPRTSLHQGAASGLAILAARGASHKVERFANRLTPDEESLTQRIATRALIAGAGSTLRRFPDDDDATWPAGMARLVGDLVEGGALGGIVYEVTSAVLDRTHARFGERRVALMNAAAIGFALYKSREYLKDRREFFTDDFDALPLTLPKSLGIAAAMTAVGTGVHYSYSATRRGMERFYGPGVVHGALARGTNAALWASTATAVYWAGISYVGKANEKIDPGYADPPSSPLVSGGPESLVTFEDLGQQGRRYVTDVVTPDLIDEAMGAPGPGDAPTEQPIRVYVGFNSQPLYPSGRSETALEELERTGAYDRGTLLLVSPTGTGWVDHTMIEAAELLTRGDIASVCVQYGRFPSFLSLQKVRSGRQQFRQLVWGVHQRLSGVPEDRRPRVLVFGESLGAWASSDVVMKQGISGLDHYGIDRALWFGMPQLARWSAAGMSRPGQLCPAGTVGVFDRWEELEMLTPQERDALRIVQLSHDNDPITLVAPTILYRRPEFLEQPLGRGVPEGQQWSPVVTFLQTMVDAANAMRDSPGDFRSTGHDYRADTARFVAEGYRLPYTEDQLAEVETLLRSLERERAARITAPTAAEGVVEAPARRTEAHRRAVHLPKLHGTRTAGARWLGSLKRHTASTEDPTASGG